MTNDLIQFALAGLQARALAPDQLMDAVEETPND